MKSCAEHTVLRHTLTQTDCSQAPGLGAAIKGSHDVEWKARNGTAGLACWKLLFSRNPMPKEWIRENKTKIIWFCIIVSNLLKLLVFPHLAKSSLLLLVRVLCLQPLPYWSSPFNLILLLIRRVAISVLNMFKRILPSLLLLPLPHGCHRGVGWGTWNTRLSAQSQGKSLLPHGSHSSWQCPGSRTWNPSYSEADLQVEIEAALEDRSFEFTVALEFVASTQTLTPLREFLSAPSRPLHQPHVQINGLRSQLNICMNSARRKALHLSH